MLQLVVSVVLESEEAQVAMFSVEGAHKLVL